MAYIQGSIQAPARINTFSLHNFIGGLNNRSEILLENEATNIMNMSFSNDTIMEKRFGFTHYDTFVSPTPFTFMKEYRPYTNPDELMLASNTELRSSSTKVADLAGRMFAENVRGRFHFVDGNVIRIYGRFPQESSTYVTIVGTPTDANHVFTVVNPPVGYVPFTTEHVEGDSVYDYNTKTCWYEPCQLEIEDPYKGSNVLPEKPKYIASHDGRIFLSGSERDNDNVFISDVDNSLYFPTSLPIQLPPNSDMVRGLIVYDDSVLIGREDDIYVISGKTNDPNLGASLFTLRKLNSHTGIASQQSMTLAHNFLFFLGSDGVAYALSTTNYDEKTLATQILSRQLDVLKAPISFERSEFVDATAVFHGEQWYLSVNNQTLVYHYRLRAWTVYGGMNASSLLVYQDKLIWGDGLSRISQFSEDYLDYGHPYNCLWQSKRFDMGDSSVTKQFREFQVVAFTFPTVPSDINVKFEVDYVDVARGAFTDSRLSVFGKSRWGDRFISRDINESTPMLVGVRGRLISFILSNGYAPSDPVETLAELEYYPKRQHDTLVFVNSVGKYYQYDVPSRLWVEKEHSDFNQSMKVYQVNGEFEFRHKR